MGIFGLHRKNILREVQLSQAHIQDVIFLPPSHKHREADGLDWSQTVAVYCVQQASSAQGNRQAQAQVDLPLFGGP